MFMYIPKVVFFFILFALLRNKYLKTDAPSPVFHFRSEYQSQWVSFWSVFLHTTLALALSLMGFPTSKHHPLTWKQTGDPTSWQGRGGNISARVKRASLFFQWLVLPTSRLRMTHPPSAIKSVFPTTPLRVFPHMYARSISMSILGLT